MPQLSIEQYSTMKSEREQAGGMRMSTEAFNRAPFIVIWEVTRACELKCLHCRAEAQPKADPCQLTTEEGFRLLEQIKEFGSPVVVFAGGDPLMQADLFELIHYGVGLGLRISMTPSAKPYGRRRFDGTDKRRHWPFLCRCE